MAVIIHVPSFQRQYARFWEAPHEASITWIGLLFSMICFAVVFCQQAGEEVPGNLGDANHVSDMYRRWCARCLALDDYTTPGKYKVETLMLYFGAEYLARPDVALGLSGIVSVVVRLAMHTGLHRDPKHYTSSRRLTAFEGEMRRRVWTLLVEVDVQVSFQFGLPPNIFPDFYDALPPRNIFDEDFDEDSETLPPARPETVRTPVLYSIAKNRIITAFASIVVSINARTPTSYEDVMRLDARLEAAHDAIPPILTMRPVSNCITDPIDLIMQRYWIDLLYEKARTVLHRRFLGIARKEPRYAYSRWTCLSAAMMTLRHQYDVHVQLQPGGRLHGERWLVSALGAHDFLLADMILCLELSYLLRSCQPWPPGPGTGASAAPAAGSHSHAATGDAGDFVVASKPLATQIQITGEQLLGVLKTSRLIWHSHHDWAQAGRAFKILSRLLSLCTGEEYKASSSPESSAAATSGSRGSVSGSASVAGDTTLAAIPGATIPSVMETLAGSHEATRQGGGGGTGASRGSRPGRVDLDLAQPPNFQFPPPLLQGVDLRALATAPAGQHEHQQQAAGAGSGSAYDHHPRYQLGDQSWRTSAAGRSGQMSPFGPGLQDWSALHGPHAGGAAGTNVGSSEYAMAGVAPMLKEPQTQADIVDPIMNFEWVGLSGSHDPLLEMALGLWPMLTWRTQSTWDNQVQDINVPVESMSEFPWGEFFPATAPQRQ